MMSKIKAQDPKSKTPSLGERHLPSFIVHSSLFIVAFLLRLAPLGRYVTHDEPNWVYRAIRFADALAARDWTAVPSTGHPGVTTMWLGAAGVAVRRLLAPAESTVHLNWVRRMAWLSPENGEAFRHLAPFLPWGRVAIVLATTLGLAVLYLLLARIFDRRVALLTVGLLAFDPFLVGHSGLLHTDALLATFSLLALATALNGLRESRRAARALARLRRPGSLPYLAQCAEIGLIIWMIQALSLSIGTHKILWMILAWCAALSRLAAVREAQPDS